MADLRADARRNREELLAIARQVIAEQGTDASLRDIARRAGVGIGTLYRHFPTREALLAAVIAGGVARMTARAAELSAANPPDEALALWLADFVSRIGPYRGLPGTMLGAAVHEDSELHATCAAMTEACRELLARAQENGTVRPDTTWEDVFTAAVAISGITAQSGPEPASRVLAVYLDGLRR